MSSKFNCPSCGSEATQRLSMVYENGISDINSTSHTAGAGLGGSFGGGLARTSTKGVSQTALSQRAAPPAKKRYLMPLFMIFLAALILSLLVGKEHYGDTLFSITWLFGSIAWIAYAFKYNISEWPVLKSEWNSSFLCGRCNHTFLVHQDR